MSSCACDPTPVTFGEGVALLRCSAHDRTTWLVDGEPADVAQAFAALRELFTEQRRRPVRRPVRRRAPASGLSARVVTLPDTSLAATPASVTDEALTALLQARGLQGSWAIA